MNTGGSPQESRGHRTPYSIALKQGMLQAAVQHGGPDVPVRQQLLISRPRLKMRFSLTFY